MIIQGLLEAGCTYLRHHGLKSAPDLVLSGGLMYAGGKALVTMQSKSGKVLGISMFAIGVLNIINGLAQTHGRDAYCRDIFYSK